FGLRDALHAMAAAFELEMAVRAVALDVDDDFLESAAVAFGEIRNIEAPAFLFAVLAIHLVEIAPEEGGLFATGAGADFQEERIHRVVFRGDELVLQIF